MNAASPIASFRVVGKITRAHGVKGGLKVRPETDDPHRFDGFEAVFLGETEGTLRQFQVMGVDYQPVKAGMAILLRLDGVDDRDQAEALRGTRVWVRDSDLPPLREGEVFLSDLVGSDVYSTTGVFLGRIENVLEHPAHPTLSVRKPDGSEALVPFVRDLIPEVDLDTGRVVVESVEGLLEGEPVSERE